MTQYVRSTPELEHHVLRRVREGDYVPDGEVELFASVSEMPRSTLGCFAAVRRTTRRISPQVVHAHSSLAGLFVRASVRNRSGLRVVYTPHCFAFERLDVSSWKRALFLVVEWLLALNTAVIAGCAPHEAKRAARWRSARRAVYVPNIATLPASMPGRDEARSRVVTVGRAAAQKDPAFYAAFARELVAGSGGATPEWIGDGSLDVRAELEASGVEVTGWLARSEALARVASAKVYAHTALWEGFPMSVLEAVRIGTPVVARRIDAFAGAPGDWLVDSPQELCERVRELLADPAAADANVRAWRLSLAENTPETQRARLLESYELDLVPKAVRL